MAARRTRIPATVSLTRILPSGAEGGKEFARVVDLLLFHEARERNETFMVFDDSAGDYHGLDSFSGPALRRAGTTGYQYKFFSSPLSARHRKSIEDSLKVAINARTESGLARWILVTPDDLMESGTKKGGGDLTWFRRLQSIHAGKVEIDHIGHKKLQLLFLNSKPLALSYYPELIPSGPERKKSIEAIRAMYDANLRAALGKIEFIGMSVYKEDAARGVPIEHIYIPLSAVSETADDTTEDTPRVDPLTFLRPGARHVVLGDPGSGKSTLLSFLALVGISKPLQSRCGAPADERLSIRVTLRRYADELRTRYNLSLLDYIIEIIQADFSLKAADQDFFEYYLESGRCILLFDGLDELPSPHFKRTIRDRISTYCTTYPGNTVVVTSRVVGYESEFRFDDKEFSHLRLGRLRLKEIESFIDDWYTARIENKVERTKNVRDLTRIIAQQENHSIRDLASNPLLLTIIALVHRIDAILPDERVVLYQKCTETLLNTWHKWKYREDEDISKARVERRNRRRIEAIAYWMQCRSSNATNKRSIVPYCELRNFLCDFISDNEKIHDGNGSPEEFADEFLTFVRRRTGLLIEVGDEKYSFVHLTFQEYLAATNLITEGEASGIEGIWGKIVTETDNPRWREVLRLLVASLKSDESKRFFIKQLMRPAENESSRSLLVGGFLIDGIEAAEELEEEILIRLIQAGSRAALVEDVRSIASTLRMWANKSPSNINNIERSFGKIFQSTDDIGFTLIGVATGLPGVTQALPSRIPEQSKIKSLFNGDRRASFGRSEAWRRLDRDIAALQVDAPGTNLLAALLTGLSLALSTKSRIERLYEQQLQVLACGIRGPHTDLFHNLIGIGLASSNETSRAIRGAASRLAYKEPHQRERFDEFWGLFRNAPRRRLGASSTIGHAAGKEIEISHDRRGGVSRIKKSLNSRQPSSFWRSLRAEPFIVDAVVAITIEAFEFTPEAQWQEALRVGGFSLIPSLIGNLLELRFWTEVIRDLQKKNPKNDVIYSVAWLVFLDLWLRLHVATKEKEETGLEDLIGIARSRPEPPIQLSIEIRDFLLGEVVDPLRLSNLLASEGRARGILDVE